MLLGVGAFLYLRFEAELSNGLDRGLRSRAGEIAGLVQRSPAGVARSDASALETDESVAQVLDARGRVLASTEATAAPLLTPGQLARARRGPTFAERPGDARLDEAARLLALPVEARGQQYVVVVGASIDEQREALSSLLVQEAIGFAGALLAAVAAGYLVAGVALRPVEAIRREADRITGEPDRRLPVPPVDDELGRLGTTLNAMLDRLDRALAAEREAAERRSGDSWPTPGTSCARR